MKLMHRRALSSAIVSAVSTLCIYLFTSSAVITMPFIFFSAVVTWIYLRNKSLKQDAALALVWPEVIDHMVSGIHSGLSLSEAMVGLSKRGPDLLRPVSLRMGNINIRHFFDSRPSNLAIKGILHFFGWGQIWILRLI